MTDVKRERQTLEGTRYFETEAEFLSATPAPGVHAIRAGSQWFDLRYDDRGSDCTMIGFHSSLGAKNLTLPMFSGGSLAADVGVNYIGVSDASLGLGGTNLAWYLGNMETGPLMPRLTPLIRHLLGDRHALLFGASGGGYAAVKFGQGFPDSTVFVANPRLNMVNDPPAKVASYMKACHNAIGVTVIKRAWAEFATDDLADVFASGLPFDLVLLQNQEDSTFLEGQTKPFLARHGGDPRLKYVQLHNGTGHVPVPRRTLLEELRAVVAPGPAK